MYLLIIDKLPDWHMVLFAGPGDLIFPQTWRQFESPRSIFRPLVRNGLIEMRMRKKIGICITCHSRINDSAAKTIKTYPNAWTEHEQGHY